MGKVRSPTELYWYNYLFPKWIYEQDPKKETWKKELMAGNFQGNDSSLVENICCAIESLGGDTLHCYIADLSMGTDFLASGLKKLPLSVQITSVQPMLSESKKQKWYDTLQYWMISRGLFVSYHPLRYQIVLRIGQKVFQSSDQILENCYCEIDIDR